MDMNFFRGVITVVLLVAFVALWIWAWGSKRRKHFEEAAKLPFRDEEIRKQNEANGTSNKGDENKTGDSQ